MADPPSGMPPAESLRVILFGATGMVGQGVLRECLLDPGVSSVVTVGRTASAQPHPKLRELVLPDLFDLSPIESRLSGFDAGFFCVGVTSVGLSEERYHHLTFDLTLAVGQSLARLNPRMTFIYVSGMGSDSSERGRTMWARVRGKTENALLRLQLKAVYIFRLGAVVPLYGIRSKTKLYNALYTGIAPLLPLLYRWFPKYVTTTEQIGRAMVQAARRGAPKTVLENADINRLA